MKIDMVSFLVFNGIVTLVVYLIPGGCPHGVMVKVRDCRIVVSEFIFQSRYYIHFRANTLEKGMNPLILPAMGKIVPLLFFLGEWLWH